MPYRNQLRALVARLEAAEAARDAARAEVTQLRDALLRAPLRPAGPTPELGSPDAAPFRSVPGGELHTVTIYNRSGRTLGALWLGYDGRERLAGTIVSGGSVAVRARVGHCWRLVDARTGEVLRHVHIVGGVVRYEYRD